MKLPATFVLATAFIGSIALAGSAAVGANEVRDEVDYEASFARSFPESGGEHRIVDWELYTALVAGDVVTYASKVDASVAKELEQAKGKAYQTQQLEGRIKHDARLRAAFDAQRRRMKSMVVYADGGGIQSVDCQHALVYVGNEFRLVLGQSSEGQDPLSHATIAPACPEVFETGFQITGGRSTRFKCWRNEYVSTCGWRLPDMPPTLKQIIESIYPGSMTLRWRWRGLGGVVQTRYVDSLGNRVGARKGAFVTVPADLGLEFVDKGGRVVWTAEAMGHNAAPARPAGL
jgi:hypothetical protein